MNSVGCFQRDSYSKTCHYRSLWFEDLLLSQATAQGGICTLMAGEVPGPGFAGLIGWINFRDRVSVLQENVLTATET